MKSIKDTRKIESLVLYGVIALFVIIYVSLIFNINIWTDEAFTISITRDNDYLGIVRVTANDVHPFFYYFIVETIINIFGNNLIVYKAISIVAMLCTMLLMAIPVRRMFGAKVSFWSILWFNAIPCIMEFSVQVRSYAWLIFFMTAIGLSIYSIWTRDKKRDWVYLTLASIAVCYIHTYAMICAVFVYILLLVYFVLNKCGKKKIIPWLISGVVVGVAFVPWLFVLLNQTTSRIDNYFFEPITPKIVMDYFPELFGTNIPYVAVMIGISMLTSFVCLFVYKVEKVEKSFVLFSFAVPVLTTIVGVVVSILVTPFFVSKYVACCLGLVAIAISVGISKISPAPSVFMGLFLLLLVGVSYKNNYETEYVTYHTQEFLDYMEENMGENDLIIYNYQKFGFIYECYFDKGKLCYLEEYEYDNSYDTVWFMDSCLYPYIDDVQLSDNGWSRLYMGSFDIEHNPFLLYKVFRE